MKAKRRVSLNNLIKKVETMEFTIAMQGAILEVTAKELKKLMDNATTQKVSPQDMAALPPSKL